MQPRVESVRIAEPGQVAPGDHQRVLHGVLGPIDVAEDPVGDREEPVATDADQVGIRLPITAASRLDEIPIHLVVPRWRPSGAPSEHLWEGRPCLRSIFAGRLPGSKAVTALREGTHEDAKETVELDALVL